MQRRGRARWGRWCLLLAGMLCLLAAGLDRYYPLPLPSAERFARTVVAADGSLLRAFPDKMGRWCYPATVETVSPRYVEALIGYEDRFFDIHPGVNPVALLRAAGQWFRHGEIISGGSTLTMQVARLLDPHDRSIPGKLKQILRALQLEWHFSKRQILDLYLTLAPFGGPYIGVEAAARGYLGKPADALSHAEAALLAALPQAPSYLRPDRHAKRARQARNKVLDRLKRAGIWSARTLQEARHEPIAVSRQPQPQHAPLLARRLLDQHAGADQRSVQTTLDAALQTGLEPSLAGLAAGLPAGTSAALLVVENANLAVRAYLGSADFGDQARFGYIDMIQAIRSPGSALKPALYGMALDAGLIHSHSLLTDAPVDYAGYRPGNFTAGFAGPVSAAEALRRSLNQPAVQLLDALGPAVFYARLRQAGLRLALPAGAKPNLALVLGGGGTTLAQLVAHFTALGRLGMAGELRYRPEAALHERYLLSPGAAWIVAEILRGRPRPGLQHVLTTPAIAWKTGTSYGYRDAWALGTDGRHTVGVWVGRPDGTPLPGHYGAVTAAPILFAVFDRLQRRFGSAAPATRPASVKQVAICWPLGLRQRDLPAHLCPRQMSAWVLNDMIPPTLHTGTAPLRRRMVKPGAAAEPVEVALWPIALEPWLTAEQRRSQILGRQPQREFASPRPVRAGELRLQGVADGAVLAPAGTAATRPQATLAAIGAQAEVIWLVNGQPRQTSAAAQPFTIRFDRAGHYRITALDRAGQYASVAVQVRAAH